MRLPSRRSYLGALPPNPQDLPLFSSQNGWCWLSSRGSFELPQPFRQLNRSLGLLPSSALSRPAQLLPEWTISTSPCNTFSVNGGNPLNSVSHCGAPLQAP